LIFHGHIDLEWVVLFEDSIFSYFQPHPQRQFDHLQRKKENLHNQCVLEVLLEELAAVMPFFIFLKRRTQKGCRKCATKINEHNVKERKEMVSVLNILPKELLVCITNEWLDDTLKDVCSLDVAIANRQLRTSYVLEQWLSTKDGFKKQIQIESDKVWAAVVKWKNMRDLDIKNISLSEYSLNTPSCLVFSPFDRNRPF